MFKKIVSNLPFSPALIGQLGFYVSFQEDTELLPDRGLLLMIRGQGGRLNLLELRAGSYI